jgi:hypothetical protein
MVGIAMLNVQNVLVTTFVLALTFLVPAVVWLFLVAGLFQLIYGRAQRLLEGLSTSRKLAQRSVH